MLEATPKWLDVLFSNMKKNKVQTSPEQPHFILANVTSQYMSNYLFSTVKHITYTFKTRVFGSESASNNSCCFSKDI